MLFSLLICYKDEGDTSYALHNELASKLDNRLADKFNCFDERCKGKTGGKDSNRGEGKEGDEVGLNRLVGVG